MQRLAVDPRAMLLHLYVLVATGKEAHRHGKSGKIGCRATAEAENLMDV